MDADGQLAFNANIRAASCSDVFKPGGAKKSAAGQLYRFSDMCAR